MEKARITFGMIVLNGEPFVRYNLLSLYPFAHQIIVVEGACPAAKNIAAADGHSRDTTLDTLRRFKAEEDPDNKLIIVTAEDEGHPDGFWTGEKDEMSQAYAKRATGNYLWQVDSDEFYLDDDLRFVTNWLENDPSITAVTFRQMSFWGSTDYIVDGYYLAGGASNYHRLFKWGPGYVYSSHRPPTVQNADGVDQRLINWKDSWVLQERGIYLYHYALLFPKQVREKCEYYSQVEWSETFDHMQQWADQAFNSLKRPFGVHNVYEYPSWLEKYDGRHPAAVLDMMNDIRDGRVHADLRDMKDVDKLLGTWWYSIGIRYLKMTARFYPTWRQWSQRILLLVHDPKRVAHSIAQRYKSLVHGARK